jgi:hypothetical protein
MIFPISASQLARITGMTTAAWLPLWVFSSSNIATIIHATRKYKIHSNLENFRFANPFNSLHENSILKVYCNWGVEAEMLLKTFL